MSAERDDIGAGSNDSTLFAMPQLAGHAQARDDYATFAALADRLQVAEAFTEGRTAGQWLRHLYGQWRSDLKTAGQEMPPFGRFRASGSLQIPSWSAYGVPQFRRFLPPLDCTQLPPVAPTVLHRCSMLATRENRALADA